MVTPVLTAAIALAEMIPQISKWFSNADDSAANTRKIADQVVGLAKKVVKVEDSMLAVQTLSQDPKLLIEYQHALVKIESDIEHLYLQDRISARQREIAFVSAGRSNTRADIMVIAAAIGLLLCLLALGYYQAELPGEAVGIISTIAGIFGSCLKDAYNFEFGSSRGSKTKDLVNFLSTKGPSSF
jgi:hypothetical protein